MTLRRDQNSLPLDFPATLPSSFAGGDEQRLVVPVDAPTTGYIVLNGQPYPLNNAQPITSATVNGTFLRTNGVNPIAIQGSTNKKVRIRLNTYSVNSSGFSLVQAAVRVGLGRVGAEADVVSASISKGDATISAIGPASLSGAGTAGLGYLITGTGGDLGLFDGEFTFTNTDAKRVILEFGGTQYLLSVALA